MAFAGPRSRCASTPKMPPTTLRRRSGRSPCSTFRTRSVGRCDPSSLHDHAALRPDDRQADRARRDGRRPSPVFATVSTGSSSVASSPMAVHRWLIDRPEFRTGRITTRFLDETELPADNGVLEAAAVAAHRRPDPGHGAQAIDGSPRTDRAEPSPCATSTATFMSRTGPRYGRRRCGQCSRPEPYVHPAFPFRALGTRLRRVARCGQCGCCAVPGRRREVHVELGQAVDGADLIVVIEAMKMLHTLTAGGPGVVDEVRVAPGSCGDQPDPDHVRKPGETEDA